MREIVYIQAGTLSNYTGTHFWNTQESYFTYDEEEEEEPLTNHDISFREGIGPSGEPTYCPRAIIFDFKSNFGTLSTTTALFGQSSSEADVPLWSGSVIQHMQKPIPQSSYRTQLERSDPGDGETGLSALKPLMSHQIDDMRYWSDYRHVDFTPRSIQHLPDPPDWEDTLKTWRSGQELFSRFNKEHEFMDTTFRQFLEECNCPQGIQVMSDAGSFGSFTSALLTSFRDEYAKMPSFVLPNLSMNVARTIDPSMKGAKAIINDALYLRSLYELSSMTVPIQSPSTWSSNAWSGAIRPNVHNPYHASAILSAHVETITLPLRSKGTGADLSSFSGQLNWRKSTPFCELSGIFPVQTVLNPGKELYNFTLNTPGHVLTPYAWRDTTRGLSMAELSAWTNWRANSISYDTLTSVDAPAYPLPTSFPPFFTPSDPSAENVPIQPILPKSTKVVSSLATTSAMATLFSGYARFAEAVTQRTHDPEQLGVDLDELRELGNELWTIHDNYSDDRSTNVVDYLGEDE